MKKLFITLGFIVLAVLIIVFGIWNYNRLPQSPNSFRSGSSAEDYCRGASSTQILVGTTATEVFGTTSGRAFARITTFGTTTVSLSFLNGQAAVINQGVVLGATTTYIDFGLKTAFPYVGAVSAIAPASGGIQVTQCVYFTQ